MINGVCPFSLWRGDGWGPPDISAGIKATVMRALLSFYENFTHCLMKPFDNINVPNSFINPGKSSELAQGIYILCRGPFSGFDACHSVQSYPFILSH